MKKYLILSIMVLTVLMAPLTVLASGSDGDGYETIAPFWVDLNYLEVMPAISGSTFYAYVSMSSKNGTYFTASYTLYLERYSNGGWSVVSSTPGSYSGTSASALPYSFKLDSRGTYRVRLSGTISGVNGRESVAYETPSRTY